MMKSIFRANRLDLVLLALPITLSLIFALDWLLNGLGWSARQQLLLVSANLIFSLVLLFVSFLLRVRLRREGQSGIRRPALAFLMAYIFLLYFFGAAGLFLQVSLGSS